jgi:glycosidase
MTLAWHRSFCMCVLVALLAAALPLAAPPPAAAQDPPADEDAALVREPARNPNQSRVFYFVMPDRFANGDPSNDFGGLPGGTTDADVLRHGFSPQRKGYYHGGDLKGLIAQLDYLKNLGISAIWMTPMFKNRPVQANTGGTPTDLATASAGYHGYWITDFTQMDPHFGSNAELEQVIDEAHARGMKVFFDIITNHTADVISYAENSTVYRPKAEFPYKDANGNVFDDRDFAARGRFPALSPAVSFPYTPVFLSEEDKTIKKPDWLNNPIYYHNRGDFASAGIGEKALYGDFFVLDDLFTEHPVVVRGMTDIYKAWVRDFDIDGFRIDTVKHVNTEFWQSFIPEIEAYARAQGKPEFFMFGEVFDSSPSFLSQYTTDARLPATLDFGFQSSATAFANSGGGDNLRDFFAQDDYYTDVDSNAYSLPTFLGNHDMGRIGRFIATSTGNISATEQELLERLKLAHGLMFFARGMPVIYYGDEQGFTGDGGDQDARQDMFPSQVPSYNDDNLIGTDATAADDNFNPAHPLYQTIAGFSQLRGAHQALQFGHQIQRFSSAGPGIFAFSRVERSEKVEYLVALNNAETAQSANIPTFSPNLAFTAIYSGGAAISPTLTADLSGTLAVALPPLSLAVYRAAGAITPSAEAPAITMTAKTKLAEGDDPATGPSGRFEVAAELGASAFAEVTFAVKVGNAQQYVPIGTDTNAPYRVFYDSSALAPGTRLSFKAIVNDLNGHLRSTTIDEIVGLPEGSVCPAGDYAIVHYQRPGGDYADTQLSLTGAGIEPSDLLSGTLKAFEGEDAFGRFAFIRLSNPFRPISFTVQKNGAPDVSGSFTPGTNLEIWLKQGDPTVYTSEVATRGNVVTVHYQRPAGDYSDSATTPEAGDYWGLHLWGDAIAPSEITEWTAPKPSTLTDTFGAVYTITVVDPARPVNFIVHTPGGDSVPATREPGGDRSFTPELTPEIWLKQGDAKVYPSRESAEAGIISATIHYRRPAGDYGDFASSNFADYWSLYTWTGAREPSVTWETSSRPTFTDTFGIAWTVPLTDNATQLNYIIHKGEEKQPPGNQELVFARQGYEVWHLQDREAALLPRANCTPVNNTVAPEDGGSFVGDGSILLSFPGGAVTSTVTLTYAKLPNPPDELIDGRRYLRAFRLTALDANLNPVTQFPVSYTLTISYTEAELAVANISDEAQLRLARLGRDGTLELLPPEAISVDAANNRVTITLNRLSDFALVGPGNLFFPFAARAGG